MPIGFQKGVAELRVAAATRVDAESGRVRLKYITETPGQDATYMSKLDDARRYVAAGYPADSAPYPWIHAESSAVGVSAQAAADYIIATANQWAQIGAQIEGARQAAKQALKSATTAQQIYQIEQQFYAAVNTL